MLIRLYWKQKIGNKCGSNYFRSLISTREHLIRYRKVYIEIKVYLKDVINGKEVDITEGVLEWIEN